VSKIDDNPGPYILVGMCIGFILCAFLFTTVLPALWPMTSYARDAAVKAGKAEYYLDADNNRQWRWKP